MFVVASGGEFLLEVVWIDAAMMVQARQCVNRKIVTWNGPAAPPVVFARLPLCRMTLLAQHD